MSRAQAALDAVSALEKGHAQYLVSRSGKCGGRGDRGRQGRGHRPGVPRLLAVAALCHWGFLEL